jgi:hypothetical protein
MNKQKLLRIFVSSTDKAGDKILYEALVFRAKEAGLKGATVLKGVLGYGGSSVLHSYKFWEVEEKIPTVIEIVDEEEKIMKFYESIRPRLEAMRYGCLVTITDTEVLLYKAGQKKFF